MMLRCDEFPLVYVEDHHHDENGHDIVAPGDLSWQDELEALLGRNAPFVLISGPMQPDPAEAHEDRKARTLWLKQNRARLLALCAGAVVVESNGPTSLAVKTAAKGFGKAFGIEFKFVADDAAARQAGWTLIERRKAAE